MVSFRDENILSGSSPCATRNRRCKVPSMPRRPN
jgi:hypothetical protein